MSRHSDLSRQLLWLSSVGEWQLALTTFSKQSVGGTVSRQAELHKVLYDAGKWEASCAVFMKYPTRAIISQSWVLRAVFKHASPQSALRVLQRLPLLEASWRGAFLAHFANQNSGKHKSIIPLRELSLTGCSLKDGPELMELQYRARAYNIHSISKKNVELREHVAHGEWMKVLRTLRMRDEAVDSVASDIQEFIANACASTPMWRTALRAEYLTPARILQLMRSRPNMFTFRGHNEVIGELLATNRLRGASRAMLDTAEALILAALPRRGITMWASALRSLSSLARFRRGNNELGKIKASTVWTLSRLNPRLSTIERAVAYNEIHLKQHVGVDTVVSSLVNDSVTAWQHALTALHRMDSLSEHDKGIVMLVLLTKRNQHTLARPLFEKYRQKATAVAVGDVEVFSAMLSHAAWAGRPECVLEICGASAATQPRRAVSTLLRCFNAPPAQHVHKWMDQTAAALVKRTADSFLWHPPATPLAEIFHGHDQILIGDTSSLYQFGDADAIQQVGTELAKAHPRGGSKKSVVLIPSIILFELASLSRFNRFFTVDEAVTMLRRHLDVVIGRPSLDVTWRCWDWPVPQERRSEVDIILVSIATFLTRSLPEKKVTLLTRDHTLAEYAIRAKADASVLPQIMQTR